MKISNAIYSSPNLRYDAAAQVVVFERLNPETGDVTFQAPSRAALKEQERQAAIGPDHGTGTAPSSSATPTTVVAEPQTASAEAGAGRISILV